MGAGEILILLIVGIVVVGPQKLPGMMRTAGQWVSRLRRMSTDLRAQSGIDRIIRDEGLEKELRELRSLSRAGVLDSLMQASAATRAPLARPVRQPIGAAGLGTGSPPTDERAALPTNTSGTSGVARASAPPPLAPSAPPLAVDASAPAAATTADSAAPRLVVRPAESTVARHEIRDPYRAFREREYPTSGCDHYDAMPDDLDEPEEPEGEALVASENIASAEAASVEPLSEPSADGASTAALVSDRPDPSSPASTEPARTEA
jgi:sec-independent protein translocase protein TatB